MDNIPYCWSGLYTRFTRTPELATFRRYIEEWSWILYNRSLKIERLRKKCNEAIAVIKGFPVETSVLRVTDFPRSCVGEEDDKERELGKMMDELEKEVREFSRDLHTAYEMANMPERHNIFVRDLAQTKDLFEGNAYGPTKEDASIYSRVPAHPDTCALKEFKSQACAPEWVLNNVQPANEQLRKFQNWVLRKEVDAEATPQKFIEEHTVQKIMDLLAAVYAPALFSGSLAVLSCINSELARIGVLGILGILLTMSLMLIVPTIKRAELFAISAAYFAVEGVYIGAKSYAYHQIGA